MPGDGQDAVLESGFPPDAVLADEAGLGRAETVGEDRRGGETTPEELDVAP
jgi:hypothetical protein